MKIITITYNIIPSRNHDIKYQLAKNGYIHYQKQTEPTYTLAMPIAGYPLFKAHNNTINASKTNPTQNPNTNPKPTHPNKPHTNTSPPQPLPTRRLSRARHRLIRTL